MDIENAKQDQNISESTEKEDIKQELINNTINISINHFYERFQKVL